MFRGGPRAGGWKLAISCGHSPFLANWEARQVFMNDIDSMQKSSTRWPSLSLGSAL